MYSMKRLWDLGRALVLARELETHDHWTGEQLARHRGQKLARLVRHAVRQSSFYRELYSGLQAHDVVDLQRLPVIDKKLLMDNFDDVVTDPRLKIGALQEHLRSLTKDDYYLGKYRIVATAGTSGLRGVFVYDRAGWSTVLANTIRWTRFTGIRPRWPDRVGICSIGADNPMHVTQRIPESAKVGLFKVLHLEATEPISALVSELNRFKPDVIQPYPSVAALLAEEQLAGRLRIRPKVVATHSEVLTDEMVRRIKSAWGISPLNHYGLTEEPHVGCECTENQGIHILEDTCIVEVTDDEGQPVPAGVLGKKYFLTNLYNMTQPLIRYEVTDMLAMNADPCACGRPFPLVSQIGGRSEDILRLEDDCGHQISIPPMVLSIRIEAHPEVTQYKLRHSAEGIQVSIVAQAGVDRGGLKSALQNELRMAIEAHGASSPPVDVTFADSLEREPRRMGKVKLVGAADPPPRPLQ